MGKRVSIPWDLTTLLCNELATPNAAMASHSIFMTKGTAFVMHTKIFEGVFKTSYAQQP
jgi:hypothetical protein